MIWLRLAWKEISNHRKFSLFFIFNLALGLFGFILLDSFETSLRQSLLERSKNFLAADLAVSGRREISEDERKLIQNLLGPNVKEGKSTAVYSMLTLQDRSRLVEIRAIDESFPFYGQLRLQSEKVIESQTEKEVLSSPVLWVDPEVLVQLNAQVGQTVQLGKARFKIADVVVEDTGTAWQGVALAPTVYIGLSQLASTDLLKAGSTAWYSTLYRLPSDRSAEAEAKKIDENLKDPVLRVVSHQNASEQMGRMMGYLSDYLGLAALVALFLASVGAAYLFRTFLARRLKEIAILISLGSKPKDAQKLYWAQLLILGFFGAALSIVLTSISLPLIYSLLGDVIPFPLPRNLSLRSAIIAILAGSIASLLICAPFMLRIRGLKPSMLFQENIQPDVENRKQETLQISLRFLPAILGFWLIASWQANSWVVGSAFTGSFLVSGLVIAAGAWAFLRILDRFSLKRNLSALNKLSIRNLTRSPVGTVSCFLAIALGSLLLNLVPQIRQNLETEITHPSVSELPSLFLFDIQDEQVSPLQELLKSQGKNWLSLSPLIRARLSEVNGKPFEKLNLDSSLSTREQEQEARSRNRGYNLTYRSELSDSETLVDGKSFSGVYQGDGTQPAEVSVEVRFAKRLGLELGDVLSFDVQGVKIEGKIVNFRRVEWTSFQPNFFVTFQPGVLNEAPKTFLLAIPKLSSEEKSRIQNQIVTQFPNVSIVDVGRTVEKILKVFLQMSWAIQWMALLSVFAGLVVLFSIANHQAHSRKTEISLLKILGARVGWVTRLIQVEFALLALGASAAGAGMSLVLSFALSAVLFDGLWVFSWKEPLISVLIVSLLSVLTATFAARRTLLRKPELAET